MKQLGLFLFMCVLSLGLANAQAPAIDAASDAAVAEIEFTSLVHDFGPVEKGVPAEATFSFENTGLAPLIITQVKGSCGCTVTDYTKQKILPGKQGMVKATYNAAKVGAFNKSIKVTSNALGEPLTLYIKGVVE